MNFNKYLKVIKFFGQFWGFVYVDSGVFQKTNKQQQNVMLRGTGRPHSCAKLLGVFIDCRLKFTEHVDCD